MSKPKHLDSTIICWILGIILLVRLLFVGDTLPQLGTALSLLCVSTLIIYLLAPLVNRMEKNLHWPRLLCLCITYLFFLLLIFLLIYFLLPRLLSNIGEILPESAEDLITRITDNPFLGRFLTEDVLRSLLTQFPDSTEDTLRALMAYSSQVVSGLSQSFRYVGYFFIALTMAFYGLMNIRSLGDSAAGFLYKTIPERWADRLLSLIYIIDRALRDFVVSKLVICLILGLLTYLTILLCNLIFRLEIPYPLLIALLTAFFNLIPYVGPFLGAIPCLLLALFAGWMEVVVLLATLLLMQQVDNMIISPRVMSRSIGISPFWVLASVSCLSLLFGIWASVFAVPVAAVIQTLLLQYQEYFARKKAGDAEATVLHNVPESWKKKHL